MLATISRYIDAINLAIGRAAAWLCVFLIVITVGVVVLRSVFNLNSLAAQESVTYAHATLFLLCIAMGVLQGEHVRVDVFYRKFSPLTKAWVDALGTLLLLFPFALFLVVISWNFASRSWAIGETSSDTGGLAYVFLLKSLLPLTGILLAGQALSQFIKNLLTILYIKPSRAKNGGSANG